MILPSKHIRVAESLFGLGGIILSLLTQKPKTVDELWLKLTKLNNSPKLPAYHTFDNLILCLLYLFSIGAIDINQGEKIFIIKKYYH